MSKQTVIPQTTVRYYDVKGTYRESRFHIKEELEAFQRRAVKAGAEIAEVVSA